MSSISNSDAKTRKNHPLYSGVIAYFPDALLAIAAVSKRGNDQHNPGQPLHWSREKSNDHLDCAARHIADHASGVPVDVDEGPHLAKAAWRLLAQLQLDIEAAHGATVEPVTKGPLNFDGATSLNLTTEKPATFIEKRTPGLRGRRMLLDLTGRDQRAGTGGSRRNIRRACDQNRDQHDDAYAP